MDSDQVAEEGLAAARRGASVAVIGTPATRLASLVFQIGPRRSVGRFLSNKRKQMAD
jgi:hypothetical protein